MKKITTRVMFLLCIMTVLLSIPVCAKTIKPKAYKKTYWTQSDIKKGANALKTGKNKIKIPSYTGGVITLNPKTLKTTNLKNVKQSSVVFLKFKVPITREYTITLDKVKYDNSCDFNIIPESHITEVGTVVLVPQTKGKGVQYFVGGLSAASKKVMYDGTQELFSTASGAHFKAKKGSTVYFVMQSYAASQATVTIK